jgi:hypothetical protein
MSYQPPVYRSTSSLAIVSLVFGISTWFVLPFVGAIVAVVCGHMARSEIRRAPAGTLEGEGMAIAGMVLGYVHLALMCLLVLIGVVLMLLGFSFWHWH